MHTHYLLLCYFHISIGLWPLSVQILHKIFRIYITALTFQILPAYLGTYVLHSQSTLTINCLYFSSGQDEPAAVSTEVKVYGKDGLGVYSISTFSFFLVFLRVHRHCYTLTYLRPCMPPAQLALVFSKFQHFSKDSLAFIQRL